eukprot:1006483-Pyramimonas_sp.AAC.1
MKVLDGVRHAHAAGAREWPAVSCLTRIVPLQCVRKGDRRCAREVRVADLNGDAEKPLAFLR